MLKNILCLFICALLGITLMGCSSDDGAVADMPSICTAMGQSPQIDLEVGTVERISFKIDSNESIYPGSLSVFVSDSDLVDVIYSDVAGSYVYYDIVPKSKGTATIYLEMPGKNIRSEMITLKISNSALDRIYAVLGENHVISMANGSTKTVCFYIGEDVSIQHVLVVPSEEGLVNITFNRRSGPYFYFDVAALKKGTFNLYAEIIDTDIRSEVITVNIVAKNELPENTEIAGGFICNVNSATFHLPTCGSVSNISDENKIIYSDASFRQTIIDAGYTPCRNCNP